MLLLLQIIIPVILLLGSIGNLISIYVFTRPSVKGLSTFKFLAYLSLIDQLYLLVGLSHILAIVFFGYDFRNYSNLVCSVHSFLTLYLSHLSSNILAAVGVFRCVTLTSLKPVKPATRIIKHAANLSMSQEKTTRITAQNHNHHNNNNLQIIYSKNSHSEGSIFRRLLANFGHADAVVVAIAFVIFLFDSHFLFLMRLDLYEGENSSTNQSNLTNELTSNQTKGQLQLSCYPSQQRSKIYYEFYTKVYPWIDQFLYSYIPFGIMIVSTILIIYRLFTINKKLHSRTTTTETTLGVCSPHEAANNNESSPMRPRSITRNKLSEATNESLSELIKSPINNRLSIADRLRRGGGVSSRQSDVAKRRSKKNSQIYKLLLTLNIFFFVLVTPLVVSNSLGWLKEQTNVTTQLVYIFAYLNHCLNFVFYGFSCKMYRSIMYDLIKSKFNQFKLF